MLAVQEPPCWVVGCCAEPVEDGPVPVMPAWMVADDLVYGRPGAVLTGPCSTEQIEVFASSVPVLSDQFAHEWALVQQHTARMWRVAATMQAAAGPASVEFVGDSSRW